MADSALTIVGHLTADPKVRYSQGGRASASFKVAVNNRWKNAQTNEWEERVAFMQCWAHGSLAENVAASCSKGSRVVVVGTLEQREWQDDDGQKVVQLGIQADECAPALKFATAIVVRNERKASQ